MAIVTNSLGKDSRWLQLEVCREFQRNKCSRPDTECKFAHPASNVEVQNGRVVACYDSIKGRCNREKPPCKYFHPPQHLKDQLLINGRNYLALKNALQSQSQMSHLPVLAPAVVGIASSPVVSSSASSASSYLASAAAFAAATSTGPTRVHHLNRLQRRKECESRITGVPVANGGVMPNMASAAATYAALSRKNQATSSPYMTSLPAVPPASAAAAAYGTYPLALIPNLMSTADHLTNYGLMHAPTAATAALITAKTAGQLRTDRLEICREHQRGNCKRQEFDCRYAHVPEHVHVDADGLVTVCMDFLKGGGAGGGGGGGNRSGASGRGCTRDQCRYFHPPSHLQAQLKARSVPIVPSTVTAAAAAAANAANLTAAAAAAAVAAQHQQHQANQHHHHQIMSNHATAIPSTADTMSLVSLVPQHHLTLATPARPTHPYRL